MIVLYCWLFFVNRYYVCTCQTGWSDLVCFVNYEVYRTTKYDVYPYPLIKRSLLRALGGRVGRDFAAAGRQRQGRRETQGTLVCFCNLKLQHAFVGPVLLAFFLSILDAVDNIGYPYKKASGYAGCCFEGARRGPGVCGVCTHSGIPENQRRSWPFAPERTPQVKPARKSSTLLAPRWHRSCNQLPCPGFECCSEIEYSTAIINTR